MKKEFLFDLGLPAISLVSGFNGIIIARAEHLTGCNRYYLQPKMKVDEQKYPDGMWFDEQELEITGKKIKLSESKEPGGFPSFNK